MQRNLGAKSDSTVNFNGNSKIVAEGVVVFNNENNRKNMKNWLYLQFKGFFSFPRCDVINVQADVWWRGRAVSDKSPHRF